MDKKCSICPRRCNAVRSDESGSGFCKSGVLPKIARVAPHFGEEPCISGTRGSGTIFFSGCTLKCVFCQNHIISNDNFGKTVPVERLCEYYKRFEAEGVHNINLVNPTHYAQSIIKSFEIYRPKLPIVYNSSGYEKTETLKMFEGIIDIYLPDFKYSDDYIAKKYSGVSNYVQTAVEAITEMIRQTGTPRFNEDGIMTKGTIIRHLILPNNIYNSIDALDIIEKTFPGDIPVSLMSQYTPLGNAKEYSEINRTITEHEYNKVVNHIIKLGLNGYVQELSSAGSEYVPEFDLSGV